MLRGLHFQYGEHTQAKLIKVLSGEVLDVALDLRKNSSTFGEHIAESLSADNKKQLFIPRGFAHGYLVLSESCEILYKCDNYYNPQSESGISYNDPHVAIQWKFSDNIIISDRDKTWPNLSKFISSNIDAI